MTSRNDCIEIKESAMAGKLVEATQAMPSRTKPIKMPESINEVKYTAQMTPAKPKARRALKLSKKLPSAEIGLLNTEDNAKGTVLTETNLRISDVEKSGDSEASGRMHAMINLPTVANIGVSEPQTTNPDDDRPASRLNTNERLPIVVNEEEISERADVVDELISLQRERRFAIVSQSRCDRSCEAYIARYLGYHSSDDEKSRKEIWDKASTIRKTVEKSIKVGGSGRQADSKKHTLDAASVCAPIIVHSANARKAWDEHRAFSEKANAQARARATRLALG